MRSRSTLGTVVIMANTPEDPRLRVARYREGLDVETLAALEGRDLLPDDVAPDSATDGTDDPTAQRRLLNHDVEVVARTAIDKAIADGQFDNLAYAGRPLPDVVTSTDPDWWTKSLMRREEIHADQGMAPEALLLRVVDAELDEALDALHSESEVTSAVESFNRRVVEARRQLLGGPPVITQTRDVGQEVDAWRARRRQRAEAEHRRRAQEENERPPRKRRRRRK
ncbi:MAG: DUF1992 domain-containing protein [Galactobacter sp.]